MEAITLFAQIDQSSVSPSGRRESDEWVFDAFVATEAVKQGLVPSEGTDEEALDVHYPVVLVAIDGELVRRHFRVRPLISGTAWYEITLQEHGDVPARVIGAQRMIERYPFPLSAAWTAIRHEGWTRWWRCRAVRKRVPPS